LNGDGTYDEVQEFGDGGLGILDLIMALRAVTGVPGFVPPACSDRFDAMDSYPLDTTSRGGDGKLGILDLITTLRRTVNVDTSRPTRVSRGLTCGLPQSSGSRVSAQALRTTDSRIDVRAKAVKGAIEFGSAQTNDVGNTLVPVYLTAGEALDLAGLGFSLGVAAEGTRSRLRFAAGRQAPSVADDGLPGTLALAWLDGLRLAAGRRLLLGYVGLGATGRRSAGSSLKIFGVSATTADGRDVNLSFAGH
jgi:hypothetical protein